MPVPAKHPLSSAQVPTVLEQAAPTLARKLSFLLQMPILITNEDDRLIAGSKSNLRNDTLGRRSDSPRYHPLRIPFQIEDCSGAVVFCGEASDLGEPPGLLNAVIKQFISQFLSSTPRQPRRQPRDKFVQKLLCGSYRNEQEALELAQLWRIDLAAPISVMVFDVGDSISDDGMAPFSSPSEQQPCQVQRATRELVDRFSCFGNTVCACVGDGQVAVLMSQDRDSNATLAMKQAALRAQIIAQNANKEGALSYSLKVASGNYYCGVTGVSRSYREALHSLKSGHDSHVYQLPWQPGADAGHSIVEGMGSKGYGQA